MERKISALERIIGRYQDAKFTENNHYIGGGLAFESFASKRHQDAKNDDGKLTEGQVNQLFKKATGMELDLVKAVINFAVPYMEWHHAGKLPKAYGGGMKKTYFVNARQIVDLATNWDNYVEQYISTRDSDQQKKEVEARRQSFLKSNAIKRVRQENTPDHGFYITIDRECHGKYGWFSACKNKYSLKEYWTGWEFPNEQSFNEYQKIE